MIKKFISSSCVSGSMGANLVMRDFKSNLFTTKYLLKARSLQLEVIAAESTTEEFLIKTFISTLNWVAKSLITWEIFLGKSSTCELFTDVINFARKLLKIFANNKKKHFYDRDNLGVAWFIACMSRVHIAHGCAY